jgi:hypothetical protein
MTGFPRAKGKENCGISATLELNHLHCDAW